MIMIIATEEKTVKFFKREILFFKRSLELSVQK